MQKTLKDLNKTLTPEDRTKAKWLFVLILLSGFLETLGIISVLPFLTIVARPSLIETNNVLNDVYRGLGFTDTMSFLYMVGFAVMGAIIMANSLSAYTNWKISEFTHMRAHDLSVRILKIFLFLPYAHFLRRDTMDMAKNILSEVSHVTKNLFVALLHAISKLVICFFIIAALILNNPVLALTVGGILSISYAAIYYFVRQRLHDIGEERLKTTSDRFAQLSETLKGIKEIRVSGSEQRYINSYSTLSYATSMSYAQYDTISVMPKYVLETIAFSAIIIVVLVLMRDQQNFLHILPELGFYAIAGQKLLPSLQNIFLNITKIKYGLPALREIVQELELENETLPSGSGKTALPFETKLDFNNVSFKYNAGEDTILDNISFSIKCGQKIAFVGPTGSGKSTIIDILSGLIFPDAGTISADHLTLNKNNIAQWQKNISYVPQNIFLFNDSFIRNIAITSENNESINMERAIIAAKIAQLHDFIIQETPNSYETRIGENGIRLSGGQKQRLGLARAIYADRPILILDEATSALDNLTEQAVIDAIGRSTTKKTLIMVAHRLSTIANCDVIYYMEDGKILQSGTYAELLKSSPKFSELVQAGTKNTNDAMGYSDADTHH